MRTDKRQWSSRRTLILEIIAGIALLTVTFLFSTRSDMAAAEARLYSAVEYMKEQCNASHLRDLASEAKSLLRVSESVTMIQECLWDMESVDGDALENCARKSFLDGVMLLDEYGAPTAQNTSAPIDAGVLLSQVDLDSLLDTATFKEKVYTARIESESGGHTDIAATGRSDRPGVIVGYYCTSAQYAQTFNNSINHLVDGYDVVNDGTIVISSANHIVASNDDALIGTDINDTKILQCIMERGTT